MICFYDGDDSDDGDDGDDEDDGDNVAISNDDDECVYDY